MVGMVAAMVLGPWVAGAGAQTYFAPVEQIRAFYSPTPVIDDTVEMAVWNESTTSNWVYVTGWMTVPALGGGSGTVMAVARYNATNMAASPIIVHYPSVPLSVGTDQYKATGITIDPVNGDVFICGEVTKAGGTMDYHVVKYKSDLTQYMVGDIGRWAPEGAQPENARIYDGGLADRPVDIAFAGTGASKRVFVTGWTQTATNGKDYFTIAYDAVNGTPPWFQGHRFNHTSNGDDIPVEMSAIEVLPSSGELEDGLYIAIAGTSYDSTTGRDMYIVTLSPDGSVLWEDRYNPPGDDICAGLAPPKVTFTGGSVYIGMCGSTTPTPGAASDTEYAIVAYGPLGRRQWGVLHPPLDPRDGERRWDPGMGDTPTDVAYASGTFWLTGTVAYEDAALGVDAGTVAYNAINGAMIGSHIFNYYPDPGGSDEVVTQVQTDGQRAWVVGSWYNVYGAPALWSYLLLHYTHDTSSVMLGGWGDWDLAEGFESRGRALGLFIDSAGQGFRFLVTGRAGTSATGLDWWTLRYP